MSYGTNCELTAISRPAAPSDTGFTEAGTAVWEGAIPAYMREESVRRFTQENTGQDKKRVLYIRTPLTRGLPSAILTAGDMPSGWIATLAANSAAVVEGDYQIVSANLISAASNVDSLRLTLEPLG